MAAFFAEYGMFLLKSLTIVIALVLAVAGIVAAAHRGGQDEDGHVEVKSINQRLDQMKATLQDAVLDDAEIKAVVKQQKEKNKAEAKQKKKASKGKKTEDSIVERRRRLYLLDFHGDIRAHAVENLREEITAVLLLAEAQDEIVVKLESGGGVVHGYGLASSQLKRITDKGVPLTVSIDKVAASGGYMMACIANKIIAAPFAIIGSIGVVAQIPNFHKILKKNDIDYELYTAGEYKRTLTMFGENTDKARTKFTEELEDTHVLFKDFVKANRPVVDIDAVATGETWFGERAIDSKLIDELGTSDQYLMDASAEADIYLVSFKQKKTLPEKLGFSAENALMGMFDRGLRELRDGKFFG
ncbi:MAG: protease SohB [Pseudomonadales bacterium]